MRILLISVIACLFLAGCNQPLSESIKNSQSWTLVNSERWSGMYPIDIYIIQHKTSGDCFVFIRPSGEGGGAVAQGSTRFCEVAVEK